MFSVLVLFFCFAITFYRYALRVFQMDNVAVANSDEIALYIIKQNNKLESRNSYVVWRTRKFKLCFAYTYRDINVCVL